MITIESAGISDRGKKRQANEDSLFLEDSLGLYVVADGMGGHLAGEVASRMVVDTIGDYIRKRRESAEIDHPLNGDKNLSPQANRLLSIFLTIILFHRQSPSQFLLYQLLQSVLRPLASMGPKYFYLQ